MPRTASAIALHLHLIKQQINPTLLTDGK